MVSKRFMFAIYLCYGIFGLCSSLIGGIWPEMSKDVNVDTSFLGIILMIASVASGVISFSVFRIRQKIGSNYTNVLGLILFAVSMVLFSNVKNLTMLIIAPIILGLGNGIVDINSNSYVVKAYDAKWVSLMHAVWGLTAALGPMLMTFALLNTPSYRYGFYFTILIIIIAIILLLILKATWVKQRQKLEKDIVDLHSVTEEEKSNDVNIGNVLKLKNIIPTLLCFSFSNGSGSAITAWISTLAVAQKGVQVVEGATAATIGFLALMLGRTVMGFAAEKFGIRNILKAISFLGALSVFALYIPYKDVKYIYLNAAFIGFFAGPMTPLLNSSLKDLFDKKLLSVLISLAGVFGLIGVASISALMSLAANVITINNVHLIPAIGFSLLFILYSSVSKN